MYDGNLGEIDFGSSQPEVRVIGSRLYIHFIPLVEHLRVSSSYDTEWFDYNEVVCSTELIEWGRTYSTPPPHWK